jgi:hypothetical protein
VVEVNEPQVWTLISVFSAAIFAVLGVVSTLFIQVLRAEVGKVAVEIRAVGKQLDSLDRDVQAIARRVFPRPE